MTLKESFRTAALNTINEKGCFDMRAQSFVPEAERDSDQDR